MVVETEVTHHTETKVTRHTKAEVPTSMMEVTPRADTEVTTLDDMEVTPSTNMNMIAPDGTELFMHTDRGFLGGPGDHTVLTRFVDHVALRIWKGEVYIYNTCVCVLF